MANITEEEIELWYEDEKQRLTELYIKSIEHGMSVEAREKKFNKAMDNLAKQYDRKHTRLMRQRDSAKRNKEKKTFILRPFFAIGHVFVMIFSTFWQMILKVSKAKYAQANFRVSMFWIRHGYKITDGARRRFRPFYIFYIKHLQETFIFITRPFVRAYKHTRKRLTETKDSIVNTAKSFAKGTVKAFKWTLKKATAAYKWVAGKHEAVSKRYTAWVAKRIQEKLDRKQQKKEEKEKRRKEKEGIVETKLKEGETAKHVGEAPDAENTT